MTGRSSRNTNGSFDYATGAYVASTGHKVWNRRSDAGSAYSLAVSPDSTRVFVTGFSSGYYTIAYQA